MIARRDLLLAGAAFAMAGCAGPQGARRREGPLSFEAMAEYCGVYRLAPGRTAGVDRFFNDAGDGVMLWADHTSGIVRRMFPDSDLDRFSVGPGFDTRAPVEQTMRFERDGAGRIGSLVLRTANGAKARGAKTAAREEAVSFQQRDATLSGTLILPEGRGPHPAIVLLHGSGPLTRYSFGPYPRFFNALGLAVLIYDKRETGASTGRRLDSSTPAPQGSWEAYYPDDLKADALAALKLLQGRPDIDARRIGFWGSSEGGMLTTQVAAASGDVAFAICSSGFTGPAWKTLVYQGPAQMKAAGASPAEIEKAEAYITLWLDVARTGEGYPRLMAWRDEIQRRDRKDWLFYFSRSANSVEQMRWTWDHKISFDPAAQLSQVRCPVLGLYGEHDPLTDAAVAARDLREALLAGGNRDVTTHVFPGAGHSLMDASGNQMTPGVFDTLRTWLAQRAG